MVKPLYIILQETLGEGIFQGKKVLEVGCARFIESAAMKDLGAEVVAQDICYRQSPPEGVTFINDNFLNWKTNTRFGIVYLSNVALFMPSQEVFNKIKEFSPNIIAIRTMYDYPNPSWNSKASKKLYFSTPKDWEDYFKPLGYETKISRQYEELTPDMSGVERVFRYVDYIGIRGYK
jgi:uncharacterized UPF0146 family protein